MKGRTFTDKKNAKNGIDEQDIGSANHVTSHPSGKTVSEYEFQTL